MDAALSTRLLVLFCVSLLPTTALLAQPGKISAEARALLEATDIAEAALRAETLRQGGTEKRAELFVLLADPGLAEHVLQGVLTALVERNDRAGRVLDTLVRLYVAAEGRRKERLRTTLLRYDSKGSVLEAPLIALADKAPVSAAVLELVVLLADSPEEKRDASAALLQRLLNETEKEAAAALQRSLENLTFHRYATTAEWSAWNDRFRARFPEGFTVAALAHDAVEEAGRVEREKRIAEAIRAVNLLAAAKVLPLEYLDPVRTPEQAVRAAAAAQLAAAAGGDARRCDEALAALTKLLHEELILEVRLAALASAGELARDEPRLGNAVAQIVKPMMESTDNRVLSAAVVALRHCQVEIAALLGDLYLKLLAGADKTALVRKDVVAALAGTSTGAHILVKALEDKDARVRSAAANGLAQGAGDTASSTIAAVLANESDPQVALALLSCLAKIDDWAQPSASAAVLGLLGAAPALRVEAGAVSMAMLSAEDERSLTSEARERVLVALDGFWKVGLADRAERLSFAERLQQSPLPMAASGVLLGWMLAESDEVITAELARVLLTVSPADTALVLGAAESLAKSERVLASGLLLDALLDGPLAAIASVEVKTQSRRLRIDGLIALGDKTVVARLRELLESIAREAPASRELARYRARLLRLEGKPKDALAELTRGLEGEDSKLPLAALSACWEFGASTALEAGEPALALDFLGRCGDVGARRALRFMKAQALHGVGREAAALQELAAFGPGEDGPSEVQYLILRVEASLAQIPVELHLRALDDFARLMELDPAALPQALTLRVEKESQARTCTAELDACMDVAEALRLVNTLQTLGPTIATPWLVAKLERFAPGSSEGQRGIGQRLLALQRLYPNRDGLRELTPPQSPDDAQKVIQAIEAFARSFEQS